MTMLADTADAVIGAGTHTGTHTACMLDRLGRQIATVTITADPQGCRTLLAAGPAAAQVRRTACWPVIDRESP
jgi:hypothetical protein